jgi:hypothetical protein
MNFRLVNMKIDIETGFLSGPDLGILLILGICDDDHRALHCPSRAPHDSRRFKDAHRVCQRREVWSGIWH